MPRVVQRLSPWAGKTAGAARWGLGQGLIPASGRGRPRDPRSDPPGTCYHGAPGSQQTAARGNKGGALGQEAWRPPEIERNGWSGRCSGKGVGDLAPSGGLEGRCSHTTLE